MDIMGLVTHLSGEFLREEKQSNRWMMAAISSSSRTAASFPLKPTEMLFCVSFSLQSGCLAPTQDGWGAFIGLHPGTLICPWLQVILSYQLHHIKVVNSALIYDAA